MFGCSWHSMLTQYGPSSKQISLSWGGPVGSVQVVGDGDDAADVEVETSMRGGTTIDPHPPSSPQSDEEAALRFRCAGSGGAAGHPQVFG